MVVNVTVDSDMAAVPHIKRRTFQASEQLGNVNNTMAESRVTYVATILMEERER